MASVLLDNISLASVVALTQSLKIKAKQERAPTVSLFSSSSFSRKVDTKHHPDYWHFPEDYSPVKECYGGFSIKLADLCAILDTADRYCASTSEKSDSSDFRFITMEYALRSIRARHTITADAQGINSLPPELVLKISKITRCPMTLSHVCRKFRDIIINAPTLWSRVSSLMPTSLAILYILRADSTAPLSILFSSHKSDSQRLQRFVPLIIPQLERWSRIDLYRITKNDFLAILSAVRQHKQNSGKLSELCSPALSQLTYSSNLLGTSGLDMFVNSSLQKVAIKLDPIICLSRLLAHLKKLQNLHDLTLNLKQVQFTIASMSNEEVPNANLYGLSCLTLFINTKYLCTVFVNFFSRLNTPNLISLTVDLDESDHTIATMLGDLSPGAWQGHLRALRYFIGLQTIKQFFPRTFLYKIGSYRSLTRFRFITTRSCWRIDPIEFTADVLGHCRSLQVLYISANCGPSQYKHTAELLNEKPWNSHHPLHSLVFDRCNGLLFQDVMTIGEVISVPCSGVEEFKAVQCNLTNETLSSTVDTLFNEMRCKLVTEKNLYRAIAYGKVGLLGIDSNTCGNWKYPWQDITNFYGWEVRTKLSFRTIIKFSLFTLDFCLLRYFSHLLYYCLLFCFIFMICSMVSRLGPRLVEEYRVVQSAVQAQITN